MLDLCSAIYCNAGHHAHLYTGKKHSSVPFSWLPGQEASVQPLVGQAQDCGAPWWSRTPAGMWPGCACWNHRTGHITEHCDPQRKGEPTGRILSRDHSVREEDENKLSDSTGEVEKNPIPVVDIQNILPPCDWHAITLLPGVVEWTCLWLPWSALNCMLPTQTCTVTLKGLRVCKSWGAGEGLSHQSFCTAKMAASAGLCHSRALNAWATSFIKTHTARDFQSLTHPISTVSMILLLLKAWITLILPLEPSA